MTTLSPRQHQVMQCILRHWKKHGHAPTLSEIAQRLHISKPTAHGHCAQLVAKGLLAPAGKKWRGYTPINRPCPHCNGTGNKRVHPEPEETNATA